MDDRKENKKNADYEIFLRDRKLKYEKIRKRNALHNKFILPIINFIKGIINFIKTVINILAIFFKTLLGQSNTSQSSNGKNNDDDDGFFKKKRTGGLPKSRIMELKNLGTCLGST
ncbi:hypothetical protein C923_05127 [Plasmodium falciparum UGT5.1]|nr:hypothetical protein PFFVO_04647 [Plasmodium falciparum Vietnam Oak-Knoll (FVO)]EUR64819.1 hypothetical protein PFBG_05057 [Plasmodium falciparum 7G8]EWC74171.1 hypothetical protein C923_05127 [Plasmodium falciparum UGT5.1]KOB58671.1 hypothetical protein PFHG_00419 [Plasmodium falciparum HB3]